MPGGQPLFLCSPGGHCAHAMLAMLLGLRGCTAIRLIPAAAVAAAVLSRWVGWKQWEIGKGIRPKQGFARHAPTPPTSLTPHTPTSTPPHPHCECSHTGRRVGQQVKHCVQPHQNQLLDGQLVAFTVLQAHE